MSILKRFLLTNFGFKVILSLFFQIIYNEHMMFPDSCFTLNFYIIVKVLLINK